VFLHNKKFKSKETKVLDENEVTLEILKEPVEESTITQKKLNKRFCKKENSCLRNKLYFSYLCKKLYIYS